MGHLQLFRAAYASSGVSRDIELQHHPKEIKLSHLSLESN